MFEDWSTNEPSNFKPTTNQFEHCTHIWSTSCGQTDFCRWNDAPCTLTEQNGNGFRPICKQEQTVWDHPYTVKLKIKELLNKEKTGFKELFTDYQPFYTINLLLNKELLPI